MRENAENLIKKLLVVWRPPRVPVIIRKAPLDFTNCCLYLKRTQVNPLFSRSVTSVCALPNTAMYKDYVGDVANYGKTNAMHVMSEQPIRPHPRVPVTVHKAPRNFTIIVA